MVFIHGGYWQALDGSFFSHLAGGLNAHGISVAIPSYDLCPAVRVDQIIRADADGDARTGTARPAAGDQRPFRGRPSGGLPARNRLAGVRCRRCRADLVVAAYAISGLFDLGPLVGTSINNGTASRSTPAQAPQARCSGSAPARGSLDAVVGGNESAEYFRQSRTIVERWGAAGLATRFGVVAGANHFTAIAPLADPDSPMVSRLLELAGPSFSL